MAVDARGIYRPGAYGQTRQMVVLNVAIGLGFLALLVAVVFIVHGSTSGARADAATVENIAESARANSFAQRVLADVLQVGIKRHGGAFATQTHIDLNDAATGLDASLVKLESVAQSDASRARIAALHDAWAPVRRNLALLGDFPGAPTALDTIVTSTLAVSPELTSGLNLLRNDFEQAEADRAAAASASRTAWIYVALCAALVIVGGFLLRLRAGMIETKRFAGMLERIVGDLTKTTLRLNDYATNHDVVSIAGSSGIVTIDAGLRVQRPFSPELRDIFGTDDLEDRPFAQILCRVVPERRRDEVEGFLKTLYDQNVDDAALAHHPFEKVEIGVRGPDGVLAARTIGIGFRRVYYGDELTHVVASIADISERVRLERELANSERRQARQNAFLQIEMSAGRALLDSFIANTQSRLDFVSKSLRAEDFAAASRGRVDAIVDRVDRVTETLAFVERDAATMQFDYMAEVFGGARKRFAATTADVRVIGEEFLALTVLIAELRVEVGELTEFHTRFVRHAGIARANVGEPVSLGIAASA